MKMSKLRLYKKLKQFFCIHRYVNDNQEPHYEPNAIVYYSRCVKCGKVIADKWEIRQ